MNHLGIHCNRIEHFEERILANGLNWGEFFCLPPEHLETLKQKMDHNGTSLSVHVPLVIPTWYPYTVTWSLLNDLQPERRELTLRLVEEALQQAVPLKPKYLVAHFPAPTAITEGDDVDLEVLWDIGRASAASLAKLSEKYDIPIMFEGFGPTPLLTPEFIAEVATTYPTLRYCLDCAHTFIASLRDGFDYFEFVRGVAPYLGTVHLWSTRGIEDYRAYRHIPVHPSLKPEDGWVDVGGTVQLVRQVNPDCVIIIEHGERFPPELGLTDYREGVEWIKSIVKTSS